MNTKRSISPTSDRREPAGNVVPMVPMQRHRSVVVLMARSDIIDLKRASVIAQRSTKTVRAWCRQYGIGRQAGPSARMEVSAPALEMLMNGDFESLEKLRMGDRADPDVRRYFTWLGLPWERRPL